MCIFWRVDLICRLVNLIPWRPNYCVFWFLGEFHPREGGSDPLEWTSDSVEAVLQRVGLILWKVDMIILWRVDLIHWKWISGFDYPSGD